MPAAYHGIAERRLCVRWRAKASTGADYRSSNAHGAPQCARQYVEHSDIVQAADERDGSPAVTVGLLDVMAP